MKAITQTLCAAIFACAFASCESPRRNNETVFRLEDQPRSTRGGGSGARYGYGGTEPGNPNKPNQPTNPGGTNPVVGDPSLTVGNPGGTAVLDTPGGTDTPGTTDPTTGGGTTTDPVPASTGGGDKPFAKPVAGKFGHVYSPFASGKEVDVTGFPPGTEVRCPYTQNIFRVP